MNFFHRLLALQQDQMDSLIKFCIGLTFCLTVVIMVGVSLYSVVFVTQPMTGMAPADKQFFLILSDMSKYILGSLATLLAVKGKDALTQFVPPGLSTEKERGNVAPPVTASPAAARREPTLEAAPVTVGFGGRLAPPPADEPER